jgi:hypothetical protein
MRRKTLDRLADEDDRIADYEYDPGNDCGVHWLHLEWPWVDSDSCGSIHERTVKDCLLEFRGVTRLERIKIPHQQR